jgi:hypothetical protein
MNKTGNSFDILPELHHIFRRIKIKNLIFWKSFYAIKLFIRFIRIQRWVTLFLGRQYFRSKDMIEIDITYDCNLRCVNCNRSCNQAPESSHISMDRIQNFVNESINLEIKWKRIRVLGGEPTLHPEFLKIVDELLRYKKWFQSCIVEVVSNGYGDHVNSILDRLPDEVFRDFYSIKNSPLQSSFRPFNIAPCDSVWFHFADYRNGCFVQSTCGMGLTPLGYYPCAVAGGIDRVLGLNIGYSNVPSLNDDMEHLSEQLCTYCGRFLDGHHIPKIIRPTLKKERISSSWGKLYQDWHAKNSKQLSN